MARLQNDPVMTGLNSHITVGEEILARVQSIEVKNGKVKLCLCVSKSNAKFIEGSMNEEMFIVNRHDPTVKVRLLESGYTTYIETIDKMKPNEILYVHTISYFPKEDTTISIDGLTQRIGYDSGKTDHRIESLEYKVNSLQESLYPFMTKMENEKWDKEVGNRELTEEEVEWLHSEEEEIK